MDVSLSGILSGNKNDGLSSSENANNQSFGATEIRPKRDEDDDTPLHDEEMEKSDISSFNFSEPWNNSKEKNIKIKRSSLSKIINSSEKKHQQQKREAEEISNREKDEAEITSNNESGGSIESKNVGETSGQQEGEEIEGENNINSTIMTELSRNARGVGGLAHRSRGAGQKGQQKSQAGRGPKSEGID
ncbi:hypothetical protein ACQ4LE_004926 [Meloidogyne hapla]|uniref:Uncharacterized protein n=1 Tax=Meloidogyne hapla TaxID=6305 RepID=A0A1I8BJL0_MELHA